MSLSVSENGPSAPGPLKPPRGQKLGRETGILMTVIKALLSSATALERDGIKTSVEQEYKQLDKNLDALILRKQQSLNAVMQTFRHICTKIDSAKERVTTVKTNLQKCKMLLHCRCEELERLWLEGIEHKHALDILELIDRIRDVPQQFSKALTRKQYILAAETLMGAINSWTDDLDQIEGLRELKVDLEAKREKMYQFLMEELNSEVFVKSAPSILEMKKQDSGVFSPFQRSSSDRHSSGRTRMNQIKARKIYLDVTGNPESNHVNSIGVQDNNDVEEFLSIFMNCIVTLKFLPKFKEDLNSQLVEKLLGAINTISQQIIHYTDVNDTPDSKPSELIDFLQLVFAHLRVIVRYHQKILTLLEVSERRNPMIRSNLVLSKADIWIHVQGVLQSTLKMYFDLGDSKQISTNDSLRIDSTLVLDINSYFVKKKQPRQKKLPLFRFEYSLHGLTHIGDHGLDPESMDTAIDKHRFLVCKPNPGNIILIYNVVEEFILEIEEALEGEKCDLRKFMEKVRSMEGPENSSQNQTRQNSIVTAEIL